MLSPSQTTRSPGTNSKPLVGLGPEGRCVVRVCTSVLGLITELLVATRSVCAQEAIAKLKVDRKQIIAALPQRCCMDVMVDQSTWNIELSY